MSTIIFGVIMKKLPPLQYLLELFDYNLSKGTATWKERPASHFQSTNRSHAPMWNSRFKGKEAGYLSPHSGQVEIKIDGVKYGRSRILWKLATGVDPHYCIEHQNGVMNDDSIHNIRDVPSSVIRRFGAPRKIKYEIKEK